jgi:hypothetical protein
MQRRFGRERNNNKVGLALVSTQEKETKSPCPPFPYLNRSHMAHPPPVLGRPSLTDSHIHIPHTPEPERETKPRTGPTSKTWGYKSANRPTRLRVSCEYLTPSRGVQVPEYTQPVRDVAHGGQYSRPKHPAYQSGGAFCGLYDPNHSIRAILPWTIAPPLGRGSAIGRRQTLSSNHLALGGVINFYLLLRCSISDIAPWRDRDISLMFFVKLC